MDKEKVRGLIRQLAQAADIEVAVEDTVRYLPSDSHYERLLKRRAYAYHQIMEGEFPAHLPVSGFRKWSDKRQKDFGDLDAEVTELEKSMEGADNE